MKQDNNTTREKSIEWWSNLHYEKAHQLRTQYFPGAMLISHTDIEHIYLSEHPEQPAKEQSSKREEEFIGGKWVIDPIHSTRGYFSISTEIDGLEYEICKVDKSEYGEAIANLVVKAPELVEENTRLKERIKMLEFNLNEVLTCYIACGKLLTGASQESIETTPIILKAKEALNNK